MFDCRTQKVVTNEEHYNGSGYVHAYILHRLPPNPPSCHDQHSFFFNLSGICPRKEKDEEKDVFIWDVKFTCVFL